jgi:hypothetical protein
VLVTGKYKCRYYAGVVSSIYMSFQFWMYVTWFVWISPNVDLWLSVVFILCSGVLWYNFLRAWRGDPGVLSSTQEQKYRVCASFGPCSTCFCLWETVEVVKRWLNQIYYHQQWLWQQQQLLNCLVWTLAFSVVCHHFNFKLWLEFTCWNKMQGMRYCICPCTRWFKYDRDYLCVNKSQFVPVIFEPPCT